MTKRLTKQLTKRLTKRFDRLEGSSLPAPETPPRYLLCLLHGYGASASDLQDLVPPLQAYVPSMACALFSAPQPCAIAPETGREWFPLTNYSKEEILQGAEKACLDVKKALKSACESLSVPRERTMLLGFSQGGIVALQTLCRLSSPLLAVVGISTLHAPPQGAMAKGVAETPVLLVHGTRDQVVPIAEGRRAADDFAELGFPVEWHERDSMEHSIDEKSLSIVGEFLARCVRNHSVPA